MAEGDGEVVIYRDPAANHAATHYAPPASPPPRRATAPVRPREASPKGTVFASFVGWVVATFFVAFLARVYDALMGTQLSRAIPFSLSLSAIALRDVVGFLLVLSVAYVLGAYVAQRLRPAAKARGAPLIAWTLAFVAASAFITRFLPSRAAMFPAYAPPFDAATTTPLGIVVALVTLLVLSAAAWAGASMGTARGEVEAWPGGVSTGRRGRPE